jgi:hypothetical protein
MPGEPFVPHEWLAEVGFALAHAAGGFRGVALLTALCIATAFRGLMATMLRRGASPLLAGLLFGLGLLTSMVHWAARPHVFTFVFVWIWATQLEDLRRGTRRHAFWLVPLSVVWANTHGAFIVGLVLIATYLAAALLAALVCSGRERAGHLRQALHLTTVFLLCSAGSAVHPSGPALIANSFGFLGQDFLLGVTAEYRSPDFHHPLFAPFLAMLVLALIVSVRREAAPTLLLASWAAFSLHSLRNIALFVIIGLPLLAEAAEDYVRDVLGAWPSSLGRALRAVAEVDAGLRREAAELPGGLVSALAVLGILLVFASGGTLALDGSDYGFRQDEFPVEALQRLGEVVPGRKIFNRLPWGGYLLFAAWPRIPVFIDGQTDFYGSVLAREYDTIISARAGWRESLARHEVDWVLIGPDDPLAERLSVEPGWRVLHRDATAQIVVKADADRLE